MYFGRVMYKEKRPAMKNGPKGIAYHLHSGGILLIETVDFTEYVYYYEDWVDFFYKGAQIDLVRGKGNIHR